MRRPIAAAVACLLLAGCGPRAVQVTVGPPATSPAPDTPATDVPTRADPAAPLPTAPAAGVTTTTPAPAPTAVSSLADAPAIRLASGLRGAQRYDVFLATVTIDLEAFWTVAYPTIAGGASYEPIEGGVWPVWPGAEAVPGCGGGRTSYRDVRDNAFYCGDGDFIAFDDVGLFPDLDQRFGQYTVATVLAHEWGHVIQARRGYALPGVIAELQADCFAGAWMARVRSGDAAGLTLQDQDLRLAINGILEFRDTPGTSASSAGAHGSAFDRLGGFQDGLEQGVASCDTYAASPPVVLELPFNSPDDLESKGDMPLDALVNSVPQDLDRFWDAALGSVGQTFPALSNSILPYSAGGPYPQCAALTPADFDRGVVYCPEPEFVAYELGGSNAQLHDTIGDFSVGVLFADRWAEALQHRLGLRTSGEPAELQRDCLTGAWVADVVPRPTVSRPFSISPGDLDEAVQAYLVTADAADATADEALQRIRSFREGVFSGLPSCGLER